MKRATIHVAAILFACTAVSFAEGTAFTYQGRLNDGVSPVNGTCTMDTSGGGGGGGVGDTVGLPEGVAGAGSARAVEGAEGFNPCQGFDCAGGDGGNGFSKGGTSYGDLTAAVLGILLPFNLFIALCSFGLQCLAEYRPKLPGRLLRLVAAAPSVTQLNGKRTTPFIPPCRILNRNRLTSLRGACIIAENPQVLFSGK